MALAPGLDGDGFYILYMQLQYFAYLSIFIFVCDHWADWDKNLSCTVGVTER